MLIAPLLPAVLFLKLFFFLAPKKLPASVAEFEVYFYEITVCSYSLNSSAASHTSKRHFSCAAAVVYSLPSERKGHFSLAIWSR